MTDFVHPVQALMIFVGFFLATWGRRTARIVKIRCNRKPRIPTTYAESGPPTGHGNCKNLPQSAIPALSVAISAPNTRVSRSE